MRDFLGRYVASWRIRAALPYIQGNLLDIGCGTNDLVIQYKGKGIGVDICQWGKVDLVVKNSAQLPFKKEAFDTVTIIAALNHIVNREKVLIEAYRVCKHGGRIIITMIPPFISKMWHFLRKPWDADQVKRGIKKGELFGIPRGDIQRMLRESGFDISLEKSFMLGINYLIVGRKYKFH